MTHFKYTTTEEQIKKLTKQGLIINDYDYATNTLDFHGYYNVINGYREPFICKTNSTKNYVDNTYFEDIVELFKFDNTLRSIISSSMQCFEGHFKTVLANLIAKHYGVDHNKYLDKKNYKDRRSSEHYSLTKTLNKLKNLLNSDSCLPVKYYKKHLTCVPPWVLFKAATFGQVVNLTRYLKSNVKTELISQLFDSDFINNSCSNPKEYLSDSLKLCLKYRNLSAHGSRIYNYNFNTDNPTPMHEAGFKSSGGLSLLFKVFSTLKYTGPCELLSYEVLPLIIQFTQDNPKLSELIQKETFIQVNECQNQ